MGFKIHTEVIIGVTCILEAFSDTAGLAADKVTPAEYAFADWLVSGALKICDVARGGMELLEPRN